ncbi:hypothetical protein Tco_0803269 [Tanacetum coccineum]|uniref:Uncharacterized protein n=1 Tax=Tanacetum coccineum TaxID=301880 RepID=A0ABQ5A3T8_9ASTR
MDGVVPSATVASGINNGTQDVNVGRCSYTAPLNKGNVLINTNDPNNYSPSLSRPILFAKVVTGEPSRNVSPTARKSVNFRTLITPARNGVDVTVPLESIRSISEQFENTAYGFFLRKRMAYPVVANYDSLDAMLENGPLTFSDDGLSVIATKLDTPLMLESYISDMCMQSWGKSSYAREMIDLQADVELKDTIMVFGHVLDECPKNMCLDVVKNLKTLRQAARGVQDGPNVGFKPTKQVYRPVSNMISANTSDDDDLGTNGGNSKLAWKGKSFYKAVTKGNEDSKSEVEVVFDETANLMASTSLKGRSDRGYDTNSLLEQWMETKRDDDYNPYDDDFYESHYMSEDLQAICDDFDITVYGRKKK